MKSSTVRSAIESTIDRPVADPRSVTLRQEISAEWRQAGQADLVSALRRHPVLARDRSLLLTLAIEEYKARRRSSASIDLEQQCRRFREFGSSIEGSIYRQLEAQRYIDGHPELLEILSTPNWPRPGDEFGNFEVGEELGFGAAARVYLCRERAVGDRQVVVKATPYSSIEASILGRLNHPNIVRIYSTGFVDDCDLYFLCMPYCGRSTLCDLLDVAFFEGCPRQDDCLAVAAQRWASDRDLPVAGAERRRFARLGRRSYVDGVLTLAVQIADALEHAHQQHILHGDLKPSNVLLTPDGRPLLLDFNLSRDYAASPGMCGGTLPYMPPEHLQLLAGYAEPKRNGLFDAASDVFSFGALLYELLAGRTPVTLPDDVDDVPTAAGIVLAQLERGVSPLRRDNRWVSRRLEGVVLRCLAFDPVDRPATMAEVQRQLRVEMRPLAVIGRTARVRPMLFVALAGLPLIVGASAAAYVTLQPPRYLANYEAGLRLRSAGEVEEAAESFVAAVDSNPEYAPARFELARTRLALGKLDLALEDFSQLARDHGDPHSMAYVGYCFNSLGTSAAAIPWYERAIDRAAVSAAIFNNLGACYLDAKSRQPGAVRTRRAEEYLLKALQLDGTSVTVRLNLVRLAIEKSKIDPTYNTFEVWPHAKAILNEAPNDPRIRVQVAQWYKTVVAKLRVADAELKRTSNAQVLIAEGAACEELLATCKSFDLNDLDSAATNTAISPGSAASNPSSPARHFFLEPLALDRAQR